MRILAKLLCFGALVHLFNYAIDSHDTLSTFVSKMGVLFLTIALAWHGSSYIWHSYLSLRTNRMSTEGKCVLITGELVMLVMESDADSEVTVLPLLFPPVPLFVLLLPLYDAQGATQALAIQLQLHCAMLDLRYLLVVLIPTAGTSWRKKRKIHPR